MELANERFTSPVKVGNTWGKQSLIANNGILSYEQRFLKKNLMPLMAPWQASRNEG